MGKSLLQYYVYPDSITATHWIFAFYGYGQQKEVFDLMASLCAGKYGFIVFGLPYQKQNQLFSKEDFFAQMQHIIEQFRIEKITGISYSLGSRYNLMLAEYFPEKLKAMFLVAPDGVKINFWNRLATTSIAGQKLFRWLMQHPAAYIKMLTLIYKAGLLPKSLYAFSKWHVRNRDNSMMVYNTWMNMKKMIPDLKHINRQKSKHQFLLYAFFGNQDPVIRTDRMIRLKRMIPTALIIELNKGHNVLDDKLFHHIASLL